MTTRRDFIRGAGAMAGGVAAGMAFCSCAMLDAARAQQPGGAGAPAGDRRGQAGQDHRRAFALPVPRGRRPAGRGRRRRRAAGPGRREAVHRGRGAPQGDGRPGDRHGSAVDQPVLVPQGPRPRRQDRAGQQREARRTVRVQARPLRRLRLARAAVPRPRGAAARGRDEEIRPARRRDRRQRRRRGLLRSQVPPRLGEGGGARRRAVHPSAEHAGARQALQGQRLARRTPSATRSTPPSRCST